MFVHHLGSVCCLCKALQPKTGQPILVQFDLCSHFFNILLSLYFNFLGNANFKRTCQTCIFYKSAIMIWGSVGVYCLRICNFYEGNLTSEMQTCKHRKVTCLMSR